MSSNILITGAAGYIGGSIVADFLAGKYFHIGKEHIYAAVRSEEQAKALSQLGINVLQLDLIDGLAGSKLAHDAVVNIIIHTASSIDPRPAIHLITALSQLKDSDGTDTYYVHTSGGSAFSSKNGWSPGPVRETDPIFDQEERLKDSFPVRKTDVAAIEHAKERGVTSFTVVPPLVYGKGSGEWNQLSVALPVIVKTSISQEQVYKFDQNTRSSGVHISDLTALYGRIVEKILKQEHLPSGTEGYYFGVAHEMFWWEILDQLAVRLDARGLATNTETRIWPDDKFAAESLGVPEQFVQLLWNSGNDIVPADEGRIGWKPAWDKKRFLQNLDDEIDAVLELGKAKSSLIDSLFKVAGK